MLSDKHAHESVTSLQFSRTEDELSVTLCRNRRLGLWAAYMLEMDPEGADEYADEIILLGLRRNGDRAIVDKLAADLGQAGIGVAPELIRSEMIHFTISAENDFKFAVRQRHAA